MKVIYSEFKTKNALKLLNSLIKNLDWQPVSIINFGDHQKNISNFKKNIFNNQHEPDFVSLDKIRSLNIDNKKKYSKPLDRSALEKLSKYENSYFSWFEDTTGWNFSYHERRNYYYDVLSFWNYYLSEIKPDLIFFYTWPHHVSDYPLYLLAKKIYKINVMYINPIPIFEKRFVLSDSLENINNQFYEKINQQNAEININDEVNKFVNRILSKKVEIPNYVKKYYEQLDKINLKSFFKEYLKLLLTFRIFNKSSIFYKKNTRHISDKNSRLNNIEYLNFRLKNFLKIKSLKKLYLKLCQKIKDENFIVFLGNYQPEVLSNLIAGHDEDIINVIKQIRYEIPNSWKIYYKEHPNIFKGGDKGAMWRSKNFYNELTKIDGLKLIDYNLNTIDVVDQSKAVATISGTVGIEATIRGKHALIFGESWYGKSEGAHLIRNTFDLKKSLEKIQNDEKINILNVKKYLQIVYDNSLEELSNFDPRYYVKGKDILDSELDIVLEFIKNKYIEFNDAK